MTIMYDNGYAEYEPTSEDLRDWAMHLAAVEEEDFGNYAPSDEDLQNWQEMDDYREEGTTQERAEEFWYEEDDTGNLWKVYSNGLGYRV